MARRNQRKKAARLKKAERLFEKIMLASTPEDAIKMLDEALVSAHAQGYFEADMAGVR